VELGTLDHVAMVVGGLDEALRRLEVAFVHPRSTLEVLVEMVPNG